MLKKTVEDIEAEGKRVLLRVDFNVPLDKSGAISDDTRIRASLPTIEYLLKRGAKVIICSHLGRPKGKVVEELRLKGVARRLSELLGKQVRALEDCIGEEVEAAVSRLEDGEAMMLENLRFHPEEEQNDPAFAQALARLADIYVNDAFGASHRAHASVVGVANYLPAVAGFLMAKEIEALSGALENPKRPFAAIVGGAKVSDKLGIIENIISKVDLLLIGGGMVATFLKSQTLSVGSSKVEEDKLDEAKKVMEKARELEVTLLLPQDVVVADRLEATSNIKTVGVAEIPNGFTIADIGPLTIKLFSQELKKCQTIIWNGPVGVFEIEEFSQGTRALAHLLAELEATTIIGGGSTAEAVREMGLAEKMSHVSTGGGASLEFLEGKVLPGVAVLQDK